MIFNWLKKKKPFFLRFIDLQMTYQCNADCFFCIAHNNDIPTLLNLSIFEYFAHNAHMETVEELVLTGGEPTILKDFEKIIHYMYINYPRTKIRVITNAIYMHERIIDALLLDNVVSVHVSLNASNPNSYKEITGRDKFETVVNNIFNLIKKRRSNKPLVLGSFVIVKENLNDIINFIFLGKELGMDSLSFLKAVLNSQHLDSEPNQKEVKLFLSKAKNIAEQLGIPLAISEGLGQPDNKCIEPWEKVFVAYDGAVNPCCGYDFAISKDESRRGNLLNKI